MRVALLGAGGIAKIHFRAYEAMEDVEVIAVVDIDSGKAPMVTKEWNKRFYQDFDEMLSVESIDMIDICLPTFLHEEYAIRAMEKGIHVICEKPISLSLESAERMLDMAKRKNVYFTVAHVVRFYSDYEYLKQSYETHQYGRLQHALFSRIGEKPRWSWQNWMADKQKSGLAPLDLHIHDTDFILDLLGSPKSVSSRSLEDENHSFIRTLYEYDDVLVEAEGAWYSAPFPFSASFRAVFEKAILEYKEGRLVVYEEGEGPRVIEPINKMTTQTDINFDSVYPFYAELKYFIHCVTNNIPLYRLTPESSIQSLSLVLKELESIKTGNTVRL